MMRDPYDPAVAFDDLLADDEVVVLGSVPMFDRIAHWIANAKHRVQTHVRGANVRVDDDPSYLAYRVARLERALRQHMADGHGWPVTVLGENIPLPACSSGAIDCWQDGSEICVTVRFMSPDGVRMATASLPARDVADEVVNAAADSGVDYDSTVVLGGAMVACVGADRLIAEVCGRIVDYLDMPKKAAVRDHSVASNQYQFGCDVIVGCYGGAL